MRLVAIVDDEAVRAAVKNLLDYAGFATAPFASAESLLQSDRLPNVACLVTDSVHAGDGRSRAASAADSSSGHPVSGRAPAGTCRLAARLLLRTAALGVLLGVNPALAAEAPPSDAFRRVVEVLETVKNRYVEAIDEDKLVSDAINGALKGLDAHSVYLSPEAYRDLQLEMRGRFGGLGLEVALENGALKIISTPEDTPAHRAGLQAGDLILRIEETSAESMTLDQAIKRARGEPGTEVRLTVLHKSATDPEVVMLTRALIQTESVRLRMLEQNYAYLRITQFHDQTPEKMAAALEGAFRDHVDGIGGIILDLRDNPGGLVRAAVGVSAAFLPQDALVVYTQGMSDASKLRMHAKKESYIHGEREDYLKNLPPEIKTVPLVVLVNGASASAAEIVAGALQDHKRAVVLGTQSYGKGTVQTIIPLRDKAALKLTTAYYYTPNGQQIQGKGVTPDYLVEQSAAAQGGARPRVASLQPEADPPEAHGDNVSEGQLTHAVHAENKSERTSPTPAAEAEGVDRQLEQAFQLLRSLPSPKTEAQPGA